MTKTLRNILLASMLSLTTINSFAAWTKIGENDINTSLYIDFDRIKKVEGFVYVWTLMDYLKPIDGDLSAVSYFQVDCKLIKFKPLSHIFYVESMGKGSSQQMNPTNKEWNYPPPNSLYEIFVKQACRR